MKVPAAETIEAASKGNWRFNAPVDKVWAACLEVASQYQAVIGLERKENARILCVIKGRDAQIAANDRAREATFGGCYEHWLAIAVVEDSGGARVSLASFDPLTGQFKSAPPAEQALFAQVQIQVSSVVLWGEKYADIDWLKRQPRLGTKTGGSAATVKFEDYEIILGNWIAKRLRLDLGLVQCPEVTFSLERAARQLKQAAGISDMSGTVSILGSPNINAFATPNGDIYVTSGLLDSAQSIDEVAAVLAHEIQHLKNHDIARKLSRQQAGDAGSAAIRTAAAMADIGMMFVGAGGGYASQAAQSGAHLAGEAIAQKSSDYLQTGMLENFSEDAEIRADEKGCETLYLAGFSVDANMSLLAGLKEKQGMLLAAKSPVMSNLINMKPGLDKRMEKMATTISRVKSQGDKAP